ncbi:hypothetical protein PGIGA_G00261090 [Pangasianodon gigas]|nr:hypothetical protein [Pangasianodon gigas]
MKSSPLRENQQNLNKAETKDMHQNREVVKGQSQPAETESLKSSPLRENQQNLKKVQPAALKQSEQSILGDL